jgi:hypothetical protein
MRKKPFTETEVLFNKTPSGIRTSDLGDQSLSLLQRATKAEPLEDREGIQRAYNQGDSYARGDTLYVAGSHTATDWYDDFTKVPFWGDVRESHRYKQADKMLSANPQVHNIVGHSLGGSVVHELQRNHPGLRSVTYGAPSVSMPGKGGERYRNRYDPFSFFDRSAIQQVHPNPFQHISLTHDYHNFENVTSTDGSLGHENPDKTVSITE